MIGSPDVFPAGAGERTKRIELATGVVSPRSGLSSLDSIDETPSRDREDHHDGV
jgi:hypothetical protein